MKRPVWTFDPSDAEGYSVRMPFALIGPLCSATPRRDEWFVEPEHAALLRPYGLVEYGGRCLTAFGMSVMRALVDKPAEMDVAA